MPQRAARAPSQSDKGGQRHAPNPLASGHDRLARPRVPVSRISASFPLVRRPVPLWLLVLVTLSGTLAMHMFVPALTVAAQSLQVDAAAIRMTISVYIFGLAVGQLVYGPLSDVFGRRPTLLAGLALYTAGGFAATVAPDLGVLVAARLVQAAGGCAGLLLGRAIVRDTAESDDAVRRLALMNLMTMVGPGLAPLVGGLLADTFGWRAIFVLLTGLGVLNFAVSWRLLPETGKPSGRISVGSVARDYRALLGSPRFVGLAFGGGCATTSFYGYIAAAPFIFINELHRPISEVGVYLGLLVVGVSLGNILASRLIGRFTIERLLLAGNLVSLAAAVVVLAAFLAWRPGAAAIEGLMFVYCVGAGLCSPAVSMLSMSVDPRRVGSAAGLYGFTQMTVGAACTTLAGLGHDPAVAAAAVLVGAALLAQGSFRVALRAPARRAPQRPWG
jgi:DHA1 family bicyclomycin/chloramphenicol resistance-like MFS transporter